MYMNYRSIGNVDEVICISNRKLCWIQQQKPSALPNGIPIDVNFDAILFYQLFRPEFQLAQILTPYSIPTGIIFKKYGNWMAQEHESYYNQNSNRKCRCFHLTLTFLISVQLLITFRQENFPKLNKRVGSINHAVRKEFQNKISVQVGFVSEISLQLCLNQIV